MKIEKMPPKATIIGLINKKGRFESFVVLLVNGSVNWRTETVFLKCSLEVEEFLRPATVLSMDGINSLYKKKWFV